MSVADLLDFSLRLPFVLIDGRDLVNWRIHATQLSFRVICTLLAIAISYLLYSHKERAFRLWKSLATGTLTRLWAPTVTADFARLRHSLQAAYPPLLREHLTMDRLCKDIDSFQMALRNLKEPMEKNAPLTDKPTALRLFRDIMVNVNKLRKALGDYRAEIDIGSYRVIHAYNDTLITLHSLTKFTAYPRGPAPPKLLHALNRLFLSCQKEHLRSLSAIALRQEHSWTVLHELHRAISTFECFMAEKNPYLHTYNSWDFIHLIGMKNPDLGPFGAVQTPQPNVLALQGNVSRYIMRGRVAMENARCQLEMGTGVNPHAESVGYYKNQVENITDGLRMLREAKDHAGQPAPLLINTNSELSSFGSVSNP